MHKFKLASVLAAGLLSAAGASAATVTLDFNAASGSYAASVSNLYNGGTDSANASGTNYGVSFTGSVLELNNNDGAGITYFTGAPTNTVVFSNTGNGDVPAVMNVAGGFSGDLGLTYASISAPTTVNIYSGLNDTGSLLASFVLASNSDGCDASTPACIWSAVSQGFSGVAKSVDFGSNSFALFTDISITPVPLPPSVLLMSFGLAGLGLFGARRRAA